MTHVQKILRSNIKNIIRKTLQTTSINSQTSNKNQTDQTENEKETHFGFSTVKESEKAQKVHDVFANVANKYDIMNDAMSLGIHRLWKDIFMQRLSPSLNTKLLDVAGGTGDIGFRYINYLLNLPNTSKVQVLNSNSHVTICDINGEMLKVGQKRAQDLNLPDKLIDWKIEDAEKLSFPNNHFTAYTIAFGIRNVTHVDKALTEAYRVLKPGGRFMCLEFSHVDNSVLQWVYDKYSFLMIPVMGQLITGKWQPYQYLVESIRQFPNQNDFKQMIQEAGFRNVTYENLSMGVVAIHSGFKI